MASFITFMRNMEFILALRALSYLQRKHIISDSSEEQGAVEGSPLA